MTSTSQCDAPAFEDLTVRVIVRVRVPVGTPVERLEQSLIGHAAGFTGYIAADAGLLARDPAGTVVPVPVGAVGARCPSCLTSPAPAFGGRCRDCNGWTP